jgi:quercetin 2,3-dioxygenase
LPAKEKMKPASYRDIPSNMIPLAVNKEGVNVKVIAGTLDYFEPNEENVQKVSGPIQGLSTEPIYLDILLPPQKDIALNIPSTHHAFIYPYEGTVHIGEKNHLSALSEHVLGILDTGDHVKLHNLNGQETIRLLLVAGKPIHEPIVQRGPFVMNTKEEIEQAMYDYQHGQFV